MEEVNREPNWLHWARSLQAIAQTGLHFSEDKYDRDRYTQIGDLAAEILSSYGDISKEKVADLFSREFGYATPKVDVRGVVFREGRLLLVQEKADANRWTLPGGWADVNDSPRQGVEREVLEESGFEVRAVRLLAVYDRTLQGHVPPMPYHIYKIFFLCEIVGGKATPGPETTGVEFFDEDHIPELSLSRVTPRQISRMLEFQRHPEWPADFD